MKKIAVIIIVGIVILLPIAAVVIVSNKEMNKYKVESNYDLREKAYGEIVSPTRSDIKEYYTLDGKVTSESVRFMKIPECDYDNIRWLIDIGDEVCTGQKIGFSKDVKIYASCDGIVEEINVMGEDSYVRVQAFEGLLFEIIVPVDIERKLNEVMYDSEGKEFTLVKKSRQYTESGVAVTYKIGDAKNYRYGQEITGMQLYTGEVYSEVLVVPTSCVYKEYDGKYYVRVCDDAGYFLNEQEVNVGYEMNGFISITGISENVKCDAGYSYAKNDEDIPNEVDLLPPSEDYE